MDQSEIYALRRGNLHHLIESKYGGVQARLAEAIKRPSNYVWRLLSDGPHAKNIGDGLARNIEELVGLPQRWLDKTAQDLHHAVGTTPLSNVSVIATTQGAGRVKILHWRALEESRGPVTAVLSREDAAVGYAYVDAVVSNSAFAVAVKGQDMYPDFHEGERIVFDPEIQPRAGDVVLARVDNALVFRRFRPRTDGLGEAFELVAANEDYGSIWSDRTTIEVLAVMVEHHRMRQPKPQ